MRLAHKSKKLLPQLIAILAVAVLLVLPQATSADLWVYSAGMGANCVRQATPPAPMTTCSSLSAAASSSTSGETVHLAGFFADQGLHLNADNNDNTVWTDWSGQTSPRIGVTTSATMYAVRIQVPADSVTIENLEIEDGSIYNVYLEQSNNNTIQDCEIHSGGVGIYIQDSSTSKIYHNDIHENNGHGIHVRSNSPGTARFNEIKRNDIGNNGGPGKASIYLEGTVGRSPYHVQNTYIWNNFMYGADYGLDARLCDVVSVSNNSVRADDTCLYFHGNSGFTSDNSSLENNIIDATKDSSVIGIQVDWDAVSNWSSNYNDIYNSGTATSGIYNGNTALTLSAWQASSAGDANSVDTDPLFVNPNNDLHIQQGSPVNSGGVMVLGMTQDIDGDPRPNSQGDWSMGADQRDDGGGGIPEFTMLTMILALLAGVGIIFLISKLNNNHQHI